MWEFFLSILAFFYPPAANENCRDIIHNEVKHIVCSYKSDEMTLKLFNKDKSGVHYRYVTALNQELTQQSKTPMMIMNGGMYHQDLSPVGLYIENGIEHQKISTKGGWGNFHLLPNGVFSIKDNQLFVEETKTYISSKRHPDFATQSGPMLLINGKLHPKFIKTSDSLKIRNGIGISKDRKTVHFALSRKETNFWNFATLFRDELGAHNALFLDGTVSAIETAGYSRSTWHKLGIFIGVFAK